ncbi:MAG: fused MFS/spermidine synthase, partial [Chloroflexota bacterium]|nr:fused MFS/spermidine synthase [Chloroflexota bacterium]
MSTSPSTYTRTRALTLALFFLSGLSALVYEVVWVRELSLSFGVSVYAVTAVLTAFMGGLALGSWLFGRLSSRHHPLHLYAGMQLGIALFAVLSPIIFRGITGLYADIYNALSPGFYLFNLIRFGLAALVLLLPATLMGGSFPVVSQYLARREQHRGGDLGLLYAANTLGGVLGACATGLVLIRLLGASGTIYLAAGLDAAVALAALAMSRGNARSRVGQEGPPAPEATPAPVTPVPDRGTTTATIPRQSTKAQRRAERSAVQSQARTQTRRREAQLVWWGFAISGFAALGYEVVWTRLLAIFTLNAVFSFTIMLTTFLVGLALGSALMGRRVDRAGQPLALFGYLQLAIGLAAILVLYVFARLPGILQALIEPSTWAREVTSEFLAGGLAMLVP